MDHPDSNHEQLGSHTPPKKARSGLGFSLAFRVLFVSFLFIILPLIVYAFLLFFGEYYRKLSSIFEDMKLFQKDQLTMVKDFEDEANGFLITFVSLMEALAHESKKLSDLELEPILTNYAERTSITAIFLVENQSDGKLICSKSTEKRYKGIDFSLYFPKGGADGKEMQLFFAKDPIFGHSLYIVLPLPYEIDQKKASAIVSISAAAIVEQLQLRSNIFEMHVSIASKELVILASSLPKLIKMKLVPFDGKGKNPSVYDQQNEVLLRKTKGISNGFEFIFANKKRFCVIAPLLATDAYLITSVPSDILLSKILEQLYYLMILLACLLIGGGIIAFIVTHRFSRPLRQLSDVMREVGEGKLDHRYRKDRMGFEINYLGDKFNQMIVSLASYIEEVKREKSSKEAYAKELQIGHEIQQSILPSKDATFPGIDVAVYFQPAKEVAGDFFDWMIKDHEVLITVADGVGKGVSSALYSFDLRSILRSFATTHSDLAEMVIKTNRLFCIDTKDTGNFVTALLALYNSHDNTLQYVNCGHNYPFIKRATGELIRLESKGIAFGVDPFDKVDLQKVSLYPGDFFIMFTDGILEAQNLQKELYTEKRLVEVLTASKHDYPDALLSEIIGRIATFTGGEDQYDDMTVLILKVRTH